MEATVLAPLAGAPPSQETGRDGERQLPHAPKELAPQRPSPGSAFRRCSVRVSGLSGPLIQPALWWGHFLAFRLAARRYYWMLTPVPQEQKGIAAGGKKAVRAIVSEQRRNVRVVKPTQSYRYEVRPRKASSGKK